MNEAENSVFVLLLKGLPFPKALKPSEQLKVAISPNERLFSNDVSVLP
jgi:hypothetical protein